MIMMQAVSVCIFSLPCITFSHFIVNGEINVLPLNVVIGMEFTNVIAYSYDMTDSQRYIAYTRATRELIVVE